MINIPETHECSRGSKCTCASHPTKLTSCKFIVPARSPGEQVDRNSDKMKMAQAACEEAALKVDGSITKFLKVSQNLWLHPRDAMMRRLQRSAFAELAQAQFELEMSFDRVPPKPDNELFQQISNLVSGPDVSISTHEGVVAGETSVDLRDAEPVDGRRG